MFLCLECGSEIEIPNNIENNEILTCKFCGLELQATVYRGLITLRKLEFEGLDWGE